MLIILSGVDCISLHSERDHHFFRSGFSVAFLLVSYLSPVSQYRTGKRVPHCCGPLLPLPFSCTFVWPSFLIVKNDLFNNKLPSLQPAGRTMRKKETGLHFVKQSFLIILQWLELTHMCLLTIRGARLPISAISYFLYSILY